MKAQPCLSVSVVVLLVIREKSPLQGIKFGRHTATR